MIDPYIPFCGTPPTPTELWTRWTLDPVLLAGLALLLGLLVLSGRANRTTVTGWALVAILFVSPLCAASMALFSARVAQHVLLTLIAAPLLARAWPRNAAPSPTAAAALFAALFWVWHLPAPYAATLQSDLTYWAMHLSLLGSAILLWAACLRGVTARPFATFLALAGTAGQMTLLAVTLTLSRTLWHDVHFMTTAPYGFDAMGDQQLAAAFMWVPGMILMSVAIARIVQSFYRADAR